MSPRRAFRWWDCPQCRQHYNTNEALDYAFASVGIEYAKGTHAMADTYFRGYHRDNKHPRVPVVGVPEREQT